MYKLFILKIILLGEVEFHHPSSFSPELCYLLNLLQSTKMKDVM